MQRIAVIQQPSIIVAIIDCLSCSNRQKLWLFWSMYGGYDAYNPVMTNMR